jgi:UDP-N-acetylmuramoyl-tripeptide--D-alanyl-D-alanine ligase
MKPMQTIIKKILAFLARRILARYHPKVVAVAGSVGKTTTRRAVFAVLQRSFRARESHKNFNNELGVPLSIFGETASGGSSPLAWLGIFWRAAWLAYGPTREYPAVLVLEMATDHPGDLAYLTKLARPDVAVVTAISEEHTEFLGDLEGVAREEGTVVEALLPTGVAILNADDPRVAAMRFRTQARIITFGFAESADVRASGAHLESALGSYFLRFDLAMADASYPVNLSGVIGNGNVSASAAAAAAGLALGIEASLIPYGLAEFQPPPGRLRVIPGIKGTTLIDDTYNSSPQAAELALETLMEFPLAGDGRRYAALGDMLELGNLTEASHQRVGERSRLRLVAPPSPRACLRTVCSIWPTPPKPAGFSKSVSAPATSSSSRARRACAWRRSPRSSWPSRSAPPNSWCVNRLIGWHAKPGPFLTLDNFPPRC